VAPFLQLNDFLCEVEASLGTPANPANPAARLFLNGTLLLGASRVRAVASLVLEPRALMRQGWLQASSVCTFVLVKQVK
jgi:hypothetical protein